MAIHQSKLKKKKKLIKKKSFPTYRPQKIWRRYRKQAYFFFWPNLYDYTPIDNCLNNHLMPFSALYSHWLTRNKNLCTYIPLFFPHFSPSSMPSQKLLAFRVPLIYTYEYKLIEQSQSNLLTPLSAIQVHHRLRYKIFFCKYMYTPFYFPHFSLNIYDFNNILKLEIILLIHPIS